MREIRTSGSEGGGAGNLKPVLPTPIRGRDLKDRPYEVRFTPGTEAVSLEDRPAKPGPPGNAGVPPRKGAQRIGAWRFALGPGRELPVDSAKR
jgi:hypothetical protein